MKILEALKNQHILVVGDVMLDHYVWGDATRISPEAPVPVVAVDKDSHTAGGAANVALNLAKMGAEVTLVGWMGEDDAGQKLNQIMGDSGIAVSSNSLKSNRTTIVKTRVMVRNQQLCRVDREKDTNHYRMTDEELETLISNEINGVTGVILSDYGKGLISSELITCIQEFATKRKIPVAMDPKPRRRLEYNGIDIMTPNKGEAIQLAGLSDEEANELGVEGVCREIWDKYKPHNLVITLGAEGMALCREGKVLEKIPTQAMEVFDVSGAGDTVISALTLAMSAGFPLETSARFANLAAGVVVGKLGTATVSAEELQKLMGADFE